MNLPAISAPPRSFRIFLYDGRRVNISLYFLLGLSSSLQLSSLQDCPCVLTTLFGSGLIYKNKIIHI